MHPHPYSNLAFLQSSGPLDQAAAWASLDATKRKQLKQQYNDKGVSIVVSAFGGSESPTSKGLDPVTLGGQMAKFVLDTDLDGIDVVWDDTQAALKTGGAGEQWLTTFTQTLRSSLPNGQYILTHARICTIHLQEAR